MNNSFEENLIIKFIPEEKQQEALELVASGYPVQYIIGNVDFYNLEIDVNENVLIPRFETEYLIKDVINYIEELNFNNPSIFEIGTGSGCISIALKKNVDCNITSIDNDYKALKVAKTNAKKYGLKINFEEKDIVNYKGSRKKYDIIVSNPPYVPFNSLVDPKINYEPKNAIFAEDNGLFFYKVILDKSVNLLNKKSLIAFEIGDGQAESIIEYAKKYYPDAKYIAKKDLNNYDRYLYIINE